MRYVLPLTVMACALAGVALGWLAAPGRMAVVRRTLAVCAVAWIVVYGWDVNRMLANDPRYDAERWLATHVASGEVVEIYQRPTYLPRMPVHASVDRVDFDDRSIEAFRQRNPAYVVLSTAGIAGVTLAYKQDWKDAGGESDEWVASQRSADGTVMNYKRKSNVELLEGLRSGTLGYRKVADFSLTPLIRRPLIQSLNPTISIYGRDAISRTDASPATDGSLMAARIPAPARASRELPPATDSRKEIRVEMATPADYNRPGGAS
jgi:hypothetical protein